MSLDVYLTLKEYKRTESGPGIYIRENGSTREIIRAEWDAKFPGQELFVVSAGHDTEVFSRNITHNLNKMADEAGIYKHLWRPDEIGITHASQLITPLRDGLELLQSNPDKFRMLNPSNGWGTYEGLVNFVSEYLDACIEYPDAEISVSR